MAFKWTYRPTVHSGITLQWRHNGRDGVSNHQPRHCLLNRLFRRRSKKTSKLRVTGLCAGNSPVTSEFPAQRASNAENVSIWWRNHDLWRAWFRQPHTSPHSFNDLRIRYWLISSTSLAQNTKTYAICYSHYRSIKAKIIGHCVFLVMNAKNDLVYLEMTKEVLFFLFEQQSTYSVRID